MVVMRNSALSHTRIRRTADLILNRSSFLKAGPQTGRCSPRASGLEVHKESTHHEGIGSTDAPQNKSPEEKHTLCPEPFGPTGKLLGTRAGGGCTVARNVLPQECARISRRNSIPEPSSRHVRSTMNPKLTSAQAGLLLPQAFFNSLSSAPHPCASIATTRSQ